MNVFEKIKIKLFKTLGIKMIDYNDVIRILDEVAEEHNNGWILCSEKMPNVEEEVYILAKRKYRDSSYKYITTTALYEDGTVLENDSCWYWEDIDGEWDEENDCLIIPEGWWEYKHYNPDGVLNNAVDDEVIAWQPLPEPYKPSVARSGQGQLKVAAEQNATGWKKSVMRTFTNTEESNYG